VGTAQSGLRFFHLFAQYAQAMVFVMSGFHPVNGLFRHKIGLSCIKTQVEEEGWLMLQDALQCGICFRIYARQYHREFDGR
jgi:hypothetical protein